jgi:WD40 repeat protein
MATLGPGVQHIFSCRLHNDWVTKIRFFEPLDVVVTSSLDGRLRFFDLERGTVVRTCRNPEGKAVHDFVYCPGATTKFIASSSRLSRDICLWNPHSATLHATLTGHTNII